MSLPASNAMVPASASHLCFWRPHPVALWIYTHRRILAIFGPEIPLQYPELIAVQGFTDPVAIGVTQKPIVAVDRGKHSVQQSPCRPALWIEPSIVGKPNPPTVVEMRGAGSRRAYQQKLIEVPQTAAQGFNGTRALVTVMGIENIADKADALIMALQPGLCGIQAQMEALGKEGLNPHLVRCEGIRAVRQKHDIIHVADVSRQSQFVFDILIELIEINIGKELACVAADRQAASRRCTKERLMRRNKSQKLPVATFARRRVGRIMGQYGPDSRPENSAPLIGQRATRQIALQDGLQHGLVDAREKSVDVNLTEPDMVWFTQQCLQFTAGRKRSPERAVRIVVIDEALVPPRFELAHDPVVTDAVRQGGCKNFPWLRVGDDEDRVAARAVGSRHKILRQWKDDPRQVNQCALRTDSSFDIRRTSEKLRNNHVKIAL